MSLTSGNSIRTHVERPVNLKPIAKSSIVALVAAIALAMAFLVEDAQAGTDNTTFAVAVAVNVRCAIAAGSVNFASTYVSGQAGDLDADGTITVSCDPGRKVSIKLSQGIYPAPGSTQNNPLRRMANGANLLNYNLYEDASRTVVWDDRKNAVRTTRVYPYTAIIYGRVFGSQSVTPGYYSDTVVGTVNY